MRELKKRETEKKRQRNCPKNKCILPSAHCFRHFTASVGCQQVHGVLPHWLWRLPVIKGLRTPGERQTHLSGSIHTRRGAFFFSFRLLSFSFLTSKVNKRRLDTPTTWTSFSKSDPHEQYKQPVYVHEAKAFSVLGRNLSQNTERPARTGQRFRTEYRSQKFVSKK